MIRKAIYAVPYLLALFHGMNAAYAQVNRYQDTWPHTDFSLVSVDLDEIKSGGPPKDGIPAVDQPKFDDVATATKWVNPKEPVIVVETNGMAKAYPLQILIYHEIVNDNLAGIPITVTFCPLCNASIVFIRRVGDVVLNFGTTGMLRMSDLVMYDRQTESWWQQFTGKSIVGNYAGSGLHRWPSSIVSFESFERNYPEGKVLNRDTGFSRPYGRNPYHGYDDINQRPFLFDGEPDDRLPPMERVISVTVDQSYKVYPFEILAQKHLINDMVKSTEVVIFAGGELLSVLDASSISDSRMLVEATAWNRNVQGHNEPLIFVIEDGKIVDQQTRSHWNIFGKAVSGKLENTQLQALDSGVHFAFAWLAFNPNTDIYRVD